jgi:hypothetical protein
MEFYRQGEKVSAEFARERAKGRPTPTENFEARNRHRDGSAEDCSVSQQQGHHRKETIGGEAEEKSYDNPRGAPVNLRIQPGHYLLCSLF